MSKEHSAAVWHRGEQAPGAVEELTVRAAVHGDGGIEEDAPADVGEKELDAERSVPVRGLFESHLTVTDLGRSVAFYRDVVGLPVAFEVPERGAAFFLVTGSSTSSCSTRSLDRLLESFLGPSGLRSNSAPAPAAPDGDASAASPGGCGTPVA
jgi:hypothetical protein